MFIQLNSEADAVVGLASTFADVGQRLGDDVVQLVSVLRKITVKACIVFSTGLLVSVVAFIVQRCLEPSSPVVVAVVAVKETLGPRPAVQHDDATTPVVNSSTTIDSVDGGIVNTVIADRTSKPVDVKTTRRMQFSETNV